MLGQQPKFAMVDSPNGVNYHCTLQFGVLDSQFLSKERVRMEDQIGPQILLLPTANYWEWVNSSRDYALAYGASMTAIPQNAAQYHYPAQVITVVVPSEASEDQTRAIRWLKSEAPHARIDVIDAETPAFLATIFQERLQGKTRYGNQETTSPHLTSASLRLQLLWPTDYPEIEQGFGENSALYRRWGLPGHEGIDLRTTFNGRVYACAGGQVYLAHDGAGNHPYGVHVKITHQDGWKTIYAHLNEALVHAGQHVAAGELIGFADQTGASAGRHVHLSLKKEGASSTGLTPYPNDFVDPTPYLQFPSDRKLIEPDLVKAQWPYDGCLVGLQARLDEPMSSPDWDTIRSARIQALRLTNRSALSDVERALEVDPDMFVLVSLLIESSGRIVRAEEFASAMEDIVHGFYGQGVRYFEVGYEPNVTSFGFGTSWHSGREFAEWFLNVVGALRGAAPEARFGWPGLSPGGYAGMRVRPSRVSGERGESGWSG